MPSAGGGVGPTPDYYYACSSTLHNLFLMNAYDEISVAHRNVTQFAVPDAEKVDSWRNGASGQRSHLFGWQGMRAGAGIGKVVHGMFGQWGAGPGAPPANFPFAPGLPPENNGIVRAIPTGVHESLHPVLALWKVDHPTTETHVDFIDETVNNSVDLALCVEDLFNGSPGVCYSGGKLGSTIEGIYGQAREFFKHPGLDVLTIPDESAVFWRYVYEQYAYPRGVLQGKALLAHPANAASNSEFVRPVDADGKPLSDRDRSDEGVDLLGRMLVEFKTTAKPTTAAIDDVLKAHLGRSLRNVLFDLHTAYYLKDYSDDDPRWRFEWAHIDGYNAATPVAKPLPVPANLFEHTAKVPNEDGLPRALRLRDSYLPGAIVPVPNPLAAGSGIGGFDSVSERGAALFSVIPDAGWAGSQMSVRAKVAKNILPPRFRIFAVNQPAGSSAQTPVPVCADPGDPEQLAECDLTAVAGGGGYELNQSVPITAETREVLLLASGADGPSEFDWAIGTHQPTLTLIEPTSGFPALVGHPDGLKRAFVIKLRLVDAFSNPVSVQSPFDFVVKVPNCAAASCTLDVATMVKLSGGNYWLIATLPDNFYPAVPASGKGTLDLEVSLAPSAGLVPPAIETDALEYAFPFHTQTTMFALDISGSMLDFDKFEGLKKVTKALLQTLLPLGLASPDQTIDGENVGIVRFNEDADTPIPVLPISQNSLAFIEALVDGMNIPYFGNTSIGDGALEAQGRLSQAFDTGALATPSRQVMVVVSDGLNNEPFDPIFYYGNIGPDPGAHDDRETPGGPWPNATLNRTIRKANGQTVPRVATIALGQDADAYELQALADFGDGSFVFAEDPAAIQTISATMSLADSMTSAYGSTSDYDRVAAGIKPLGTINLPRAFAVEPGAAELRVTVVGDDSSIAGAHTLLSPSGVPAAAHRSTADGTSIGWRVHNPAPGTWLLFSSGIAPAFAEGTVRGRVQLFAFADVASAAPLPAQPGVEYDDLRWTGSDVFLRAVPFEQGKMTGCLAIAKVTPPGATAPKVVVLYDDGQHDDSNLGDGVYGNLFSETGVAGTYDVLFQTSCTSLLSGAAVIREKRQAFTLTSPPDSDGDGMHDEYETFVALAKNDPSDALADPDADGLTNLVEFSLGTSPTLSDTDGGGESDLSEWRAGRDPRDRSDDAIDRPVIQLLGANTRVFVNPSISPQAGARLVVRREFPERPPASAECSELWDALAALDCSLGPSELDCRAFCDSAIADACAPELSTLIACTGLPPNATCNPDGTVGFPGCEDPGAAYASCLLERLGPVDCSGMLPALRDGAIYDGPIPPGFFELDAPNSLESCYATRLIQGDVESAWSTPACVRPALDPDPPGITAAGVPSRTPTRDVALSVALHEPSRRIRKLAEGLERGVEQSEIGGFRIWFDGAAPPEYSAGPLPEIVRLPDQDATMVQVQVRDGAGNESKVLSLYIQRPRATRVDQAIALEERAEDRIAEGALPAARQLVVESIVQIQQSLAAAIELLAKSKGKNEVELHVIKTLAKIFSLKVQAAALMKPQTLDKAKAALGQALELEIELSGWAEARSVRL